MYLTILCYIQKWNTIRKKLQCFTARRKSDVNDYKMMTQQNKMFCVPKFHTPDFMTTLSTALFIIFCLFVKVPYQFSPCQFNLTVVYTIIRHLQLLQKENCRPIEYHWRNSSECSPILEKSWSQTICKQHLIQPTIWKITVPWLWCWVAVLSLQRSGFNYRQVHAGFWWVKWYWDIFLRPSSSPCWYHISTAQHSFIHLALMLYNLSNWQHPKMTYLRKCVEDS